MKFTPRMKRAAVQSLIINILCITMFLAIIFYFVIPQLQKIESSKTSLMQASSELKELKKQGIPFNTLRVYVKGDKVESDDYTKTVVDNISETLYKEAFTNTWSTNFDQYLLSVEQRVSRVKSSPDHVAKEKALEELIPVYTTFQQEGLRDYDFINYVERLLYSFNLSSSGEIGIWDIKRLEEDETPVQEEENGRVNSLEENIFYIPLEFDVEGQKKDIFDFIHFIENVAGVSIDEDQMKVYSDSRIKTILEGDTYTPGYNIYQNQLIDISGISFGVYPDSSTFWTQEDLYELISWSQARERYTSNVELRFYVSGLPGYRMETFIAGVLDEFDALKQSITKDSIKYTTISRNFTLWTQLQALSSLQSLNLLFSSLDVSTKLLRKDLFQKTDIEATYTSALELDQRLQKIKSQYDTILNILSK